MCWQEAVLRPSLVVRPPAGYENQGDSVVIESRRAGETVTFFKILIFFRQASLYTGRVLRTASFASSIRVRVSVRAQQSTLISDLA